MSKANFLTLILLLAMFALPLAASAEIVPTCTGPCGWKEFLKLIANIFGFLTRDLALPIAAGVIVYGGVLMVTAGTNDSRRSQAKSIIGKAVFGLVLALAAWLIVFTIMNGFGVTNNFLPTYFQ